jgi:Tol biopolymer transport system component
MPQILRPILSFFFLTLVVSALAVEGEDSQQFALMPTVAFTSTRDYPSGVGSGTPVERLFASAEIYLIATPNLVFDASQPLRRVTHNEAGDNAAVLSPLGKQLVFESIRLRRADEPLHVWDLFLLNLDDHGDASFVVPDDRHVHLTRGAAAAWERSGKRIAFQASASGVYNEFTLARFDPGAPTRDSDIYVMNVDDCIAHLEECRAKHVDGQPDVLPEFLRNLTKAHGPETVIDEDPDWSPDGTIVFTRHDGEVGTYQDPDAVHNNTHAEVYLIKADEPSKLEQVTFNAEEERAPTWSPDGRLILFMCRRGGLRQFQLCVVERDATGVWQETQLTPSGSGPYLGGRWSIDGNHILFQRPVGGALQLFQLSFGRDINGNYVVTGETQLTTAPSFNLFPNWGWVRTKIDSQ